MAKAVERKNLMTIREKVARAIHSNPDPIWTVVDWNAMHPDAQALIMRQATAAINAFLTAAAEEGWRIARDEATKKMISAGKKVPFLEPNFSNSYPDKIYRAMLAAAPEFEWDK